MLLLLYVITVVVVGWCLFLQNKFVKNKCCLRYMTKIHAVCCRCMNAFKEDVINRLEPAYRRRLRSDGRYGFEKNISSCTVSYTALPMKTDLHFQPTLSKLQNFHQTSILLFFLCPQIVRNVVTLTHFFSTCATR